MPLLLEGPSTSLERGGEAGDMGCEVILRRVR